MQQFLGLFYSRKPRALQGIFDAPYLLMGRHALCARGYAFDGGAAALLAGRMRNADSLRAQVRAAGYPLTDGANLSALLLGAYRLWGEACASRVEGPAVCVVLDQDAGTLLLSRDRLGEGQVYYTARNNSVSFASHPAPLLEAPNCSRLVDAEGACELFGLGPARTPGKTPLRDVQCLPPGHLLLADENGCRLKRYFALEPREHADDERKTVETVRALIEQAVAEIAPLAPAAMLSGGLDSTALTALLTRALGGSVRTFSVDYEGNEAHFQGGQYQPEQDGPYVELASHALGSAHTRVVLPVESLSDALERAMCARGLPGMADIDSSLLLFAERMATAGPYALSGECGDEVFGGYPWFQREELIWADGFPWSGSVALRESILKKPLREKLKLPQYVDARYREALAAHARLPGESPREARLRALQELCFSFFMANLQERALRMCETHGISVLTPFSDDRLVQYVYNVPWQMKRMGDIEKGLLRRAVADLLPQELLMRKKSPYPKTYHPEYAAAIVRRLRAILADPSAPILQLIDADEVMRIMAGPLSAAQTPWFGQLMAGPQMLAYLIQINQWLLRYRIEIAV